MIKILLLLFAAPCFGQLTAPQDTVKKDSAYTFTRNDVIKLANKMKFLTAKTSACDSLVSLQAEQLADFGLSTSQKNLIIEYKDKQIESYKKNEVFYKEVIDEMRPSFLDNKWLWLILGVGLGYLIAGR